MEYTKYQQGDVLLLKVTKEEFYSKVNNYYESTMEQGHDVRAVLAEGEETDHYHAIYLEDMLEEAGVTLCKHSEHDRENRGLIVTGATVPLRHEEHNTIDLEPGYYLQRGVNEYDHISEITRRVQD